MAFTSPWVINKPVGADPANQIWQYIQDMRQDLADRMTVPSVAGSSGGGAFFEDFTADPLVFSPSFLTAVGQGKQYFVITPDMTVVEGGNTPPDYGIHGGDYAAALRNEIYFTTIPNFLYNRTITRIRLLYFLVNTASVVNAALKKSLIDFTIPNVTDSTLYNFAATPSGGGFRIMESGVLSIPIVPSVDGISILRLNTSVTGFIGTGAYFYGGFVEHEPS